MLEPKYGDGQDAINGTLCFFRVDRHHGPGALAPFQYTADIGRPIGVLQVGCRKQIAQVQIREEAMEHSPEKLHILAAGCVARSGRACIAIGHQAQHLWLGLAETFHLKP